MGFLSGRVTFTRYRVGGDRPLPFGEEILEQARQHLIGQHGMADAGRRRRRPAGPAATTCST